MRGCSSIKLMWASIRKPAILLLSLLCVAGSIVHLENARSGVQISRLAIGDTPATLYQPGDDRGPVVVVAHGFAGSSQIMQAYSLTLARAGYQVLAFDFEGHGRNPVPMSGDVTAIDGTTRLLVEQTRKVILAARQLESTHQGLALLGHSMATDVLVRAAQLEHDAGIPVSTIVGISMFSEIVTATKPASLLIINGQWEARLREPALRQLQLIDPEAGEGDTVLRDDVTRRVVVAPYVEHVSVLYSAVALRESLVWMDSTFARSSDGAVVSMGPAILLLLAGTVVLFLPIVSSLPATQSCVQAISTRRYLLAVLLPAAVTPGLALLPGVGFLPVLVADYLMLHLAVFGMMQLLVLRPVLNIHRVSSVLSGAALLVFWGIAVFGLALDRYVASFLPMAGRLQIVLVLCFGTVLFMISDSVISGAGHGRLWRRLVARLALMLSLLAAAFIDQDRLIFLLLILPVLCLFYLVHGLMGRWAAQRCGPLAAGLGLGICLAWALGVSFPLFDVAAR